MGFLSANMLNILYIKYLIYMLIIHANYNTCLTEFYHNICNLLYFELCHFGGFKTFGSHSNDQSNELIPMIVWQNILMHFGKYSLLYNFKSAT